MEIFNRIQEFFVDIMSTVRVKYEDVIYGGVEDELAGAMTVRSVPARKLRQPAMGGTVKVVPEKLIDAERLLLADKNGFLIATLIVSCMCVGILLFLVITHAKREKKPASRARNQTTLTERVGRRKRRFSSGRRERESEVQFFENKWDDTLYNLPSNEELLLDDDNVDYTLNVTPNTQAEPIIDSSSFVISYAAVREPLPCSAEKEFGNVEECNTSMAAGVLQEDIAVADIKSVDSVKDEYIEAMNFKTQLLANNVGTVANNKNEREETYMPAAERAVEEQSESKVRCQRVHKEVQVDDLIFFGFAEMLQFQNGNNSDLGAPEKVEVIDRNVQTDVEEEKPPVVMVAKNTQTEYSYLAQDAQSKTKLIMPKQSKERIKLTPKLEPKITTKAAEMPAKFKHNNVSVTKATPTPPPPPPPPKSEKITEVKIRKLKLSTQPLSKAQSVANMHEKYYVQCDALFKSRSLMFINSKKNVESTTPVKETSEDTQPDEESQHSEQSSEKHLKLENAEQTNDVVEKQEDAVKSAVEEPTSDTEVNAHGDDEARGSSEIDQSNKVEGTAFEVIGDGPEAMHKPTAKPCTQVDVEKSESTLDNESNAPVDSYEELQKLLRDLSKAHEERLRLESQAANKDETSEAKIPSPNTTCLEIKGSGNAVKDFSSKAIANLSTMKNELIKEAGKLRKHACSSVLKSKPVSKSPVGKNISSPLGKQQTAKEMQQQEIRKPSATLRILNAARIELKDATAQNENSSVLANTMTTQNTVQKSRIPIPTGRKLLEGEHEFNSVVRNIVSKSSMMRRPSSATPTNSSLDSLGRRIPFMQRSFSNMNIRTYSKTKIIPRPTIVRGKDEKVMPKKIQHPAEPTVTGKRKTSPAPPTPKLMRSPKTSIPKAPTPNSMPKAGTPVANSTPKAPTTKSIPTASTPTSNPPEPTPTSNPPEPTPIPTPTSMPAAPITTPPPPQSSMPAEPISTPTPAPTPAEPLPAATTASASAAP